MIFGHEPAEIKKAIASAIVAVAALVGFFVTFDPNTVETIVALTGAVVEVGAVYATRNERVTPVAASRLD